MHYASEVYDAEKVTMEFASVLTQGFNVVLACIFPKDTVEEYQWPEKHK